MFAIADEDLSGALTFEEFIAFLQTESKIEKEQEKQKIRDAVASNMEDNNGALNVHVLFPPPSSPPPPPPPPPPARSLLFLFPQPLPQVQKGAVTKSVTVTVAGTDANAIRQGHH